MKLLKTTYLVCWYNRDDSLESEWEVDTDQTDRVFSIVQPAEDFSCVPLTGEQVDALAEIMGFPVDHDRFEYFLEAQGVYVWTTRSK